jgi:threonine synthase
VGGIAVDEIARLKEEPPSPPKEEPPSGQSPLLSAEESQPELFSTISHNSLTNGNGFTFIEGADGATSQAPIIAPELLSRQMIAADGSYPLHERIEAFEDIVDSEVGDTTLSRARNLEREVGLRQIYFKFEGGNPTGTQKDRIAFAQAMDAMRRGFDAITVATCGNYGVAVALAASMAGLKCYVYIPEGYRAKRVREMQDYKAEIIRVQGDYETSVEVSRQRAMKDEIYDANPGGENTPLQLSAYGSIAYEIYDELRDAPAVVAAPVSNGSTLAGIYKGFLSLYRRGKTSRIPHMVAGSSHGKNPIIRAFIKNVAHCEDIEPRRIRETAVNEPLINWHSIDGDLALDAIRVTSGWAQYASDKSMISYARLMKDREGLNILPASTAGLVVLLEQHRKEPMPGDRYVVILTGRRS